MNDTSGSPRRRIVPVVRLVLSVAAAACSTQSPVARPLGEIPFAATIERLSEEGGYFDTDNLISNESSYLHVMGGLDALEVRGGAYIGVGPDQNFSYIARIRPEIAIIVDVRRDNLLQQLLFKALFEEATNRLEYLCLLYGRPVPPDLSDWADRDVDQLFEHVDSAPALPEEASEVRARLRRRIASFGLELSTADVETIDRLHRAFIGPGPDLRFTSFGRAPRFFYPTHRDLLLAEDLEGRRASYVVREEDFQFLKALEEADRVIPVVGDLAGTRAFPEIGRFVRDMALTVSALYASNVEFYLWSDGSFSRFAETVAEFPMDPRSVIIRSHFGGGFGGSHPSSVPGFYSTQLLQRMEDFRNAWRDGGFRSYGDLVTRDVVETAPIGS